MNTLTVRIESLESTAAAVARAMQSGKAEPSAGLSFTSYETLHRVLAPKRLEIVRAMAGKGVLTHRAVARLVRRDFKAVHTDLTALIQAGIVERVEDGVVFPYDTIHVEFDIHAHAA
ncbi:transcriptional regulator [Chelativorans alearense]|uniref:HVO_A0114 family putative DNA-binding protein n=1 Tax=Chelativorans alearense TaxID=2681495 RepID=UPI0013D697E2|nr:transcriptional regulator [Chelativorans alearense]